MSMIEVIRSWPPRTTLFQVRSFDGLASFYQRFILKFSSIMTPITVLMNRGNFLWTLEAYEAFAKIKILLTKAPCLALPDFSKVI